MNLDNHFNFSPIYILYPTRHRLWQCDWLRINLPVWKRHDRGGAFSCGGTRGHNSSFARGKKPEGKSRHFCRSVCVTVCEHCVYIYTITVSVSATADQFFVSGVYFR